MHTFKIVAVNFPTNYNKLQTCPQSRHLITDTSHPNDRRFMSTYKNMRPVDSVRLNSHFEA
jgi:hypothetical protein